MKALNPRNVSEEFESKNINFQIQGFSRQQQQQQQQLQQQQWLTLSLAGTLHQKQADSVYKSFCKEEKRENSLTLVSPSKYQSVIQSHTNIDEKRQK